MTLENNDASRRLALLGILLQALHVLFGITAIIGMLISHMKLNETRDTVYHSHIVWQLVTFWVGAALYAIGIWNYVHKGTAVSIVIALAFVIYRLVVSIYYYRQRRAITRLV